MLRYLKQEKGFYRYLFLLTLPMVLQNLVTTSLGLVDTFMVGLVGKVQMSAVTAANTPIFILQCCIFGLQGGLGVLMSQYWGKKDMENIRRTLAVSFTAVLLLTACTAALFAIFPQQVMFLVTDNPELIPIGADYLRIVGFSYLFNGFNMVYISAQRSMEKPQLGMYALVASMCLNTALNYILIFGKLGFAPMGVMGAAYATLISRVVETAILLVHYAKCRELHLRPDFFLHLDKSIIRAFMKYSAPVMLGELLWVVGFSMSTVIMGHMVNSTDMLAANTIAKNINNLVTVACFGLANSIAVVIGNRLGQGLPKKEVYGTGVCLMIVSCLLGAATGGILLLLTPFVFEPYLFPLFNLEGESLHIAVVMSVFNFITMPIFAFNNSMIVGILRAGGDVKAAMIIDSLPQWVLTIPLTALAALVWRLDIVWICMAMHSEALLKVPLGIWRIRLGKWVKDVTKEIK